MIRVLLILKPTFTALEHFRQITPHEYMCELYEDIDVSAHQTDGTIDGLTDEYLQQFNVIQFIRHIDMKGKTKEAVERCHKLGLKVVYDIDDYWQADKDHTLSASMKANNYQQTCVDAFTNVDWVTTTTPYFAEQIKPYNTNITILPNCIAPTDKQWEKRDITNARVRFGWVGGIFHLPDVEMLRPALERLNRSFSGVSQNDYQMCLAGFNPSKEYVEMERVLTSNHSYIRRLDPEYYEYLEGLTPAMEHISYDKPYRRIWSRQVKNYGGVYNEIDVALVPLRDTKFNNCKSELKIIEAGTMGKAVICSNVTPYREYIEDGENGLLATNWYDEIKYMIEEPEHRKDMAEALSETIKVHFNPKKIQTERYQLYNHLCQKSGI